MSAVCVPGTACTICSSCPEVEAVNWESDMTEVWPVMEDSVVKAGERVLEDGWNAKAGFR